MNDDFNIILPYAPYNKKVIPKLKGLNYNAIAT